MKTKYFNEWEFNQAQSIANIDPFEAKKKYEKYLERYPKDYSAYPYYASNLISLGKFNEAEEILNLVESMYKKDTKFSYKKEKVLHLENNILFNKLRILSYQNRYEELYQISLEKLNEIKEIHAYNIVFYCKKKIGKLDLTKREPNSYTFRQIIEYKESDFLDHIKKHLANYNKDTDNPNRSIFSPNFPILEVIEEIKKYIPSTQRLFTGYLEDLYVFKYNNCGKDNNKTVDYFRVVCFHNTQEFITMFPALNCDKLPYIDLNYLVYNNSNIKTKKLSQTEKFNKRFHYN